MVRFCVLMPPPRFFFLLPFRPTLGSSRSKIPTSFFTTFTVLMGLLTLIALLILATYLTALAILYAGHVAGRTAGRVRGLLVVKPKPPQGGGAGGGGLVPVRAHYGVCTQHVSTCGPALVLLRGQLVSKAHLNCKHGLLPLLVLLMPFLFLLVLFLFLLLCFSSLFFLLSVLSPASYPCCFHHCPNPPLFFLLLLQLPRWRVRARVALIRSQVESRFPKQAPTQSESQSNSRWGKNKKNKGKKNTSRDSFCSRRCDTLSAHKELLVGAVFVLYPSLCSKIFLMFKCRQIGNKYECVSAGIARASALV